MAISEKIEGTVENWSKKWSVRFGRWFGEIIAGGIDGFMRILGKSYAPKLKPIIDKMQESGAIPPELQPIFDEMLSPTGEAAAGILAGLGNRVVGSAVGDFINAFLRPIGYWANRFSRNLKLGDDIILSAFLRGMISPDDVDFYLSETGYSKDDVRKLVELSQVIFPSDVVGPAWLRDKEKYGKYWADVLHLGVSPDRLALLQEMVYKIPGVQDVIRYAVKEAYTPEIYQAFGQDQEFPELALPDAEKAGVRRDFLEKEWIAHWVLPSSGQGFDLLHRGKITEDELFKLLKSLDIMPFWRDKLTTLSWDLPNRIELRMMARYGLVDKAFLMEALKKAGLTEEYREVVADMNLAMGLLTDLSTRYRNGWINSEDVKKELVDSGMATQMQERIYSWIVKNVKSDRVQKELDLTAAEIIKAVKVGEIDWEDGSARLVSMGYDKDEAYLKLAINVEVTEAAPTDLLKLQIDTIRRLRRQRTIIREQEISQLLDLGVDNNLAIAYANNDDLRLVKEAAGG